MTIASKPELQIEIDRLVQAFAALAPNDTITYDELGRLVGYDVRTRGKRYVLSKAKMRFEKDYGLRLESVWGEGIRKLSADKVYAIGQVGRKRIGRIAKTASARLTSLRYNDIDPRVQARIDAERSLLGAISSVASTKGDSIAAHTKTGPMVPANIFDRIRPVETVGASEDVE